jgi:hypothetical protein
MPETAQFPPRSRTPITKGDPETKPFTQSASPGQPTTATSGRPGPDSPGIWLQGAAAGLFVLAGAAATVSFTAQYRLVFAARGIALAAALEAAIPAAALVFACLGVAQPCTAATPSAPAS